MRTIDTNDTVLMARLRQRLGDVRYYSLENHYSGSPVARDVAWQGLGKDGARLVQLDALIGVYKIIIDDHRWYVLRPAAEFEPLPADDREPAFQAA